MLEKLIESIFSKPINLESEMRKLRTQLDQLQIDELNIKSNYSTNLKGSLFENNEKQYKIINTLFVYQENNQNFSIYDTK